MSAKQDLTSGLWPSTNNHGGSSSQPPSQNDNGGRSIQPSAQSVLGREKKKSRKEKGN